MRTVVTIRLNAGDIVKWLNAHIIVKWYKIKMINTGGAMSRIDPLTPSWHLLRWPHSLMIFLIFRECEYEQDLEFSATKRQLKYRKAKDEKNRKLKRLRRLRKMRETKLKRISIKRVCYFGPRIQLGYFNVCWLQAIHNIE